MKLYRKTCKKCGEEFVTTRHQQRLCYVCKIENRFETIRKTYIKKKIRELKKVKAE